MRRRSTVVLVGVGLTLLMAAWVAATQPFAAPDEVSHYLRSLGISHGTVVGPRAPYQAPYLSPAQLAWGRRGSRGVTVPAAMAPPDVNCVSGRPDMSSCVEATTVGNYHPLPYLLPAVGIGAASSVRTGLWLGRAGSALQSLAFILLAVALLWGGTAWSLTGLLAAITPMVLFVGSVLNPNGLEIAASLAFTAALFRVARAPGGAPGWVWAAAAVSGAATILSWQLGPVFALADLAVFAGLLGGGGARALTAGARRGPRLAALTLVLAAAVWLGYGIASGVGHSSIQLSPLLTNLHAGLDQLPRVLGDAIGTFGIESVPLPLAARAIWWLLVLALLVAALRLGNRRERALVGATLVVALVFPVLFYAYVYRLTGFGLQGRYVLPLLALIPLVAGEVVYRQSPRLSSSRLGSAIPAAAIAAFAILSVYAWWYSARAAAGLSHGAGLFAHAAWSPPAGWLPWSLLAALGALALLGFAALAALTGPPPRAARPG